MMASIARLCGIVTALATLGAPAAQGRTLQAMAWADVVAAYEPVRDYTAMYDKYERAIDDGALQRIKLAYRKPLDVRLEWLDEHGKVDQIAVYRQGHNDGKVLARKNGMLGGMVGVMQLDLHSARAMGDSRHPITEVGIGHIIDEVSHAMESGRVTTRAPADDTLDGSRVVRFDMEETAAEPSAPGRGIQRGRLFGVEGVKRVSVWVDARLKLPVKAEVVDAAGRMLERHRFTDLKLNVGLTDQIFTVE